MTSQPTADEIAALEAFAAAHGRKWKSELRDVYWYNARIWKDGPSESMGYVLHGIRNNRGPSWLDDFRLPSKTKETHR